MLTYYKKLKKILGRKFQLFLDSNFTMFLEQGCANYSPRARTSLQELFFQPSQPLEYFFSYINIYCPSTYGTVLSDA